jgi:hypothetical protein
VATVVGMNFSTFDDLDDAATDGQYKKCIEILNYFTRVQGNTTTYTIKSGQ